MKKYFKTVWFFALMLVCIPSFIFSAVRWYQTNYDSLPTLGEKVRQGNGSVTDHRIDSFNLVDQDSKQFHSLSLSSKIMVVNFFFTACSSICPKMMKNLQNLQAVFSKDSNVAFISITVDPQRDTPQRLNDYATMYRVNSRQWHLLTGDKKKIYKLARKSFYLTASDGDGGEDDFIHSEQVVLVDETGRVRGYYAGTNTQSMTTLTSDIKKLQNEK